MGAEMEDIILSWGHNYLTYNEKCVEAPGEALSNYEIFRQLPKAEIAIADITSAGKDEAAVG